MSLQYKFLFIHVPKTGGNSCQNILKDFSEDKIVKLANHQDGLERFEVRSKSYDIHKHSTLLNYRDEIGSRLLKELFKFSIIRNPWDMCVSFYFSPHRGKIEYERDGFKEFIQTIPPIRNYIRLENYFDKALRRLTIRNKSLTSDIDFLMKFERLQEDFEKVCNIIGIPCSPLPRRNKSQRENYTKYYDFELIKLVESIFFEEIEFGQYEFGK